MQSIGFSATKYPNIRAHYLRGWQRILIVNRPGSAERRDKLLAHVPTRPGFDRDEYPPDIGRGAGCRALEHGAVQAVVK